MPRLHDRTAIRRILETDREWAAYALADLDPGPFEYCTWITPQDDCSALVLVYQGFSIPVLVAIGGVEEISRIVDEAAAVLEGSTRVYLAVRPDVRRLLESRFPIHDPRPMLRLRWKSASPPGNAAAFSPSTIRLGAADAERVERLYAEGRSTGASPPFFTPSMLNTGVYYGIAEGSELVAIAGTHIVSIPESVGAIGNVYTRSDRRSRGFSTTAMHAVLTELHRLELRTIVLNVHVDNSPARRVYERLNFELHCAYYEAVALLR